MNIWTSLAQPRDLHESVKTHSSTDNLLSILNFSRSTKMRSAVFAGPGEIQIEEISIPTPGEGEVRIRLEGCGVCASNLPVWEGKPWFEYPIEAGAPGHEGWGVVDAIGSGVQNLSIGDRVTMLSYRAFAEYDIAKASEVVKLPHVLDQRSFPGEPLGCAMNIFHRCQIEKGQTVAIVGIGFLGALLCRLAAQAGAHVIAISRRPFSLEMASRYGANDTILMDDHWRILDEIKKRTNDKGCDIVIEAVGKQWPLDLAGEITGERGRLIIAGYHQDGPRQVNMQLWNWRGLDVINAHERDSQVYIHGIRRAVNAVASGKIDPAPLYTHAYTLEELPLAFRDMQERPEGFVKAIIAL